MILFGIRKNSYKGVRNSLSNLFIKCDKTDYSDYKGTSLLPSASNILSNILLPSLSPYVDLEVTEQLIIRYFEFVKYCTIMGV